MSSTSAVAGPHRSVARRFVRRLVTAAFALILLGALWILVTGLIARHDGETASKDLTQLRSEFLRGDETAAIATEAQIQHTAHAGHWLTTGPAWWTGAHLGALGTPLRSIRMTTVLVDRLANQTLPTAFRAGTILNPQQVRTGTDSVNLTRLAQSSQPLAQAAGSAEAVVAAERQVPASTWLGAADSARSEVIATLSTLVHGMKSLSSATALLPGPLGATGTKRYFLAIETDAEARGLGGLPGAYAILQARQGQLSAIRFGTDADLNPDAVAHINLGRAYNETYGSEYSPRSYFGNSDPSPNFPDSARIWMAMWQDKFHQHLDGAMAIDPTALSYLLAPQRPILLPDGSTITSKDVVPFFENQIYAKFPFADAQRKAYQVRAASGLTNEILHTPSGGFFRIAAGLQRAAKEYRLLIYTRDPKVEAALAARPVGGVLPRTSAPFVEVALNNAGGNKLDYYLDRTITYQRASCAAGPATVTVVLHNGAPTSGLAPTIVGSTVHPVAVPGRNIELVSLYSTQGSSVNHVTVDGRTGFFNTGRDQGHIDTESQLSLNPGQTRTLVFDVHEPAATGPLIIRRQPTIRPQVFHVDAPTCTAATG